MIYLATDHAGFELKEKLKAYIKDELNLQAEDLGNFVYDEQDDYPDFISLAAKKVAVDPENNKAIILGGSGQGEAMVANREKGIRAAVLHKYDEKIIKLSRKHNDANILSLGARFLGEEEAKKAIKMWLETEFTGEERHQRRIDKIG